MISVGRFYRQVWRHFKREKRLSLGSFLVLATVLILIDMFWLASININEQYRQILSQVKMDVYISENLPDSLIPVIDSVLISIPEVDSVEFISKDQAARIFESEFGPGLLQELEDNPLPRSYTIRFSRVLTLRQLEMLNDRLMQRHGIERIEFDRAGIEKVEGIGKTLTLLGYTVGGFILCVVLLTMANTNRLTARSKSQDFFQLKLLGAGPAYLVYPFLAEGLLSAIIAAGLGWLAILYFAGKVTFSSFNLILPSSRDIVLYCFLAGLTGMAGAYLGIRRFIRS